QIRNPNMPTYVFRDQAIQDAKKRGYANYRTKLDPMDRIWKMNYEPGESPAAEWAKGKDFVASVETDWDRSGDRPIKLGVVVVTITREELAELPDELKVPEEFLVEPLTPSLWSDDKDNATTG